MTETTQFEEQLFSGNFDDFSLSEHFLLGLKDLGYLRPTQVQKSVFLPAREGKDLVVQSRTGSGKTTAFCLPMLTRVDANLKKVQAIVLVPTRELARQVAMESGRLGHHAGINIAAIYGGASFNAQISALESGAQVVVGTPGRVKDLIERKLLKLSAVTTSILDEADEMLSMGFWEDVTHILAQLPKERQTLLFSATLPDAIQSQLPQIVKDPIHLNLSSDTIGAKTIRHIVHIEDENQPKARNLLYAIEFQNPKSSIVFCNTKEETEVIERYLRRFGLKARALNGDMSQSARERVMTEMREGQLDLIVATDVAARGIDISGISHVFNVELPLDSDVYVHRTGRTGRIGKLGVAVNLVRPKDAMQIDELKSKFGITFEEVAFPPQQDLLWMQAERLATFFVEAAETVEVSQYREIAKSMLGRADLFEIVAFLLRTYFADQAQKITPIKQSFEPQRPHQEHKKEKIKPVSKPEALPEPTPKPKQIIPVAKPKIDNEFNDDEPAPSVFETSEQHAGSTRLYITLGRDDGFKELSELSLYIAQISGVDFGFFTGLGQLRDSSSHVEVESEYAEQIIKALHDRDRDMSRARGENASNPKILCEEAKFSEKKIKPRKFKRR